MVQARPRTQTFLMIPILLLAALAAGCGSGAADAPPATALPALTAAQRAANLASFDEIWRTVRDKYWDPDLGGVDWEAARQELRPQVAAARTMGEARAAMSALLQRLGQSHFGVIPADAYAAIEDGPTGAGDGSAGAAIREHDGHALVTFLHPDGTGSACLKTGWILDRVGGVDVDSLITTLRQDLTATGRRRGEVEMLVDLTVSRLLTGARGDTVQVVATAAGARRVAVAVPLGDPPGEPAGLGNLPAQDVWFLSRRLPPDVGYVRFNFFLDPVNVMGRFQVAVTEFQAADGLIIDLRGNHGGIVGMGMGVAGFLVAEPGRDLGTMTTRDMTLDFVLNPRQPNFTGPVAILVDGLSISTSEILAGGLQDLGRARIFGTPTPGAALPSVITRLPNGDGFQYAFASYVSTGGEPLEGRGVQPDEVVPPRRDDLLQGVDPVIRAAVAWIEQQVRKEG